MPERGVPQVVPERDRLGEVGVEPQRARDAARDLRHLEGVREPRPVVVALGREEDLRLVHEAPERLGVDDPVPVAFVLGAVRVRLERLVPATAGVRERGAGRERWSCSDDSISRRVSIDMSSPRPCVRSTAPDDGITGDTRGTPRQPSPRPRRRPPTIHGPIGSPAAGRALDQR